MQLEEVLERMLVGGRGQRGHGPGALGRRGELEAGGQRRQVGLELLLGGVEPHRQLEAAALEPGADHQPPGMLHAVDLGLLLEVEDVDVHAIEAERQGQLDQFAGAAGEGQAEGAQIAEHGGSRGAENPGV